MSEDFNIDKQAASVMNQRSDAGSLEDNSVMDLTWEPQLSKMQAFGIEQRNCVEWPSLATLKKLDVSRQMKLKSIELGFSSSLYEVRFNFSNGV